MAILNDSTGTLMSCAHRNHDCKVGVIVGKDLSSFILTMLRMLIGWIFFLKQICCVNIFCLKIDFISFSNPLLRGAKQIASVILLIYKYLLLNVLGKTKHDCYSFHHQLDKKRKALKQTPYKQTIGFDSFRTPISGGK